MDLIVKTIISEILEIEINDLNEKDDLFYLICNDYIQFAEIIYEIEEKFNIKISDEDCLKLKTIADIIDYLKMY